LALADVDELVPPVFVDPFFPKDLVTVGFVFVKKSQTIEPKHVE